MKRERFFCNGVPGQKVARLGQIGTRKAIRPDHIPGSNRKIRKQPADKGRGNPVKNLPSLIRLSNIRLEYSCYIIFRQQSDQILNTCSDSKVYTAIEVIFNVDIPGIPTDRLKEKFQAAVLTGHPPRSILFRTHLRYGQIQVHQQFLIVVTYLCVCAHVLLCLRIPHINKYFRHVSPRGHPVHFADGIFLQLKHLRPQLQRVIFISVTLGFQAIDASTSVSRRNRIILPACVCSYRIANTCIAHRTFSSIAVCAASARSWKNVTSCAFSIAFTAETPSLDI